MLELQHVQTHDLDKDTATNERANERAPAAHGVDVHKEILSQISRSQVPTPELLAQLRESDPVLFSEVVRSLQCSLRNTGVNDLMTRLDPASGQAPTAAPGERTQLGHKSFHSAVSGQASSLFDSIFNPGKAETQQKPSIAQVVKETPSSPLPEREQFEQGFGEDLGHVKVHTGPQVDAFLKEHGAQGAAIGQHILLKENSSPHTIAEEVAHSKQQGPITDEDLAKLDDSAISQPGDATEREARQIADQFNAGKPLKTVHERRAPHLAFQEDTSKPEPNSLPPENISDKEIKQFEKIISEYKPENEDQFHCVIVIYSKNQTCSLEHAENVSRAFYYKEKQVDDIHKRVRDEYINVHDQDQLNAFVEDLKKIKTPSNVISDFLDSIEPSGPSLADQFMNAQEEIHKNSLGNSGGGLMVVHLGHIGYEAGQGVDALLSVAFNDLIKMIYRAGDRTTIFFDAFWETLSNKIGENTCKSILINMAMSAAMPLVTFPTLCLGGSVGIAKGAEEIYKEVTELFETIAKFIEFCKKVLEAVFGDDGEPLMKVAGEAVGLAMAKKADQLASDNPIEFIYHVGESLGLFIVEDVILALLSRGASLAANKFADLLLASPTFASYAKTFNRSKSPDADKDALPSDTDSRTSDSKLISHQDTPKQVASDLNGNRPTNGSAIHPRQEDLSTNVLSAKEEELRAALPPKLRDQIALMVDPSLPGNETRVCYELDKNKRVTNVNIKTGPRATANDVKLHVGTIELIQRYSGFWGRLRELADQFKAWIVGNPHHPLGSMAWEAQLELEKLPRVIEDRLQQLQQVHLSESDRVALHLEINHLESQIAHYKAIENDLTEGRGFVAMLAKNPSGAQVEAAKIRRSEYIENLKQNPEQNLPANGLPDNRENLFNNLNKGIGGVAIWGENTSLKTVQKKGPNNETINETIGGAGHIMATIKGETSYHFSHTGVPKPIWHLGHIVPFSDAPRIPVDRRMLRYEDFNWDILHYSINFLHEFDPRFIDPNQFMKMLNDVKSNIELKDVVIQTRNGENIIKSVSYSDHDIHAYYQVATTDSKIIGRNGEMDANQIRNVVNDTIESLQANNCITSLMRGLAKMEFRAPKLSDPSKSLKANPPMIQPCGGPLIDGHCSIRMESRPLLDQYDFKMMGLNPDGSARVGNDILTQDFYRHLRWKENEFKKLMEEISREYKLWFEP